MSASPGPTAQETVAELLRVSRRRSQSVPLRRSFLQQEVQHGILRAGPLATFLRTRDDLALNLFLLHRALVSAPPWDATRDARVWAGALGLATPRDDGAEAVSKLWRRLDQKYHLVVRERRGRLAKITALLEDGSGKEYTYLKTAYFKIPFEFWTAPDAWYRSLSLPAKSVLLIALSLRSPFILPTEKAKVWYGISSDSAERGLNELRRHGILDRTVTVKQAPLAPTGITREHQYLLLPPFARPRRPKLTVLRRPA